LTEAASAGDLEVTHSSDPPISHPPIGSAARHSSTRTACPEHRPLSFTAVPLSPSHKKTSMW